VEIGENHPGTLINNHQEPNLDSSDFMDSENQTKQIRLRPMKSEINSKNESRGQFKGDIPRPRPVADDGSRVLGDNERVEQNLPSVGYSTAPYCRINENRTMMRRELRRSQPRMQQQGRMYKQFLYQHYI